ncbi:MAG: tetratricopeptide repeat protein [Pseudolabrys sp.]
MPVGTISLSSMHACAIFARAVRRVAETCLAIPILALFALALVPHASGQALAADPIKGEVAVDSSAGYIRLAFRFDDEVKVQVSVAGAVMVIKFDKAVNVPINKIAASSGNYISAARRDPDGMAIRFALARKIKYNVIPAAERIYLDLLPTNWVGLLPGLPQEVIDELAERARTAEKELRRERGDKPKQEPKLVRVKVGTQPTFTRYEFAPPGHVNVVPTRTGATLRLNFDRPVKWDLADVKISLPATVASVETQRDETSAEVLFTFKGKPEVRAFREDDSFMVDVGNGAGSIAPGIKLDGVNALTGEGKLPAIAPPETIPARGAAADEPKASAAPAPSVPRSAAGTAPEKAAANLSPAPQKPAATPPEKPGLAAAADAPKANVAAAQAVKPQTQVAEAKDVSEKAPSAKAPVAKAEAAQSPPRQRIPSDPNAPVIADVRRSGDNLYIDFPFTTLTPAAVFRRADMVWLVFDNAAKLDLSALRTDTARVIRSVSVDRGKDNETIVRIKLARPLLAGLAADGPGWNLTLGDAVMEQTHPLGIARNIVGRNRASITIPFDQPSKVHRIIDPDLGDTLLVVTALGPARGFLKPQDFVELHALASTHGVVIQPIADDVTAELAIDKIVVSRPGGLTISAAELNGRVSDVYHTLTFDNQVWEFNRQAKFGARQSELIGLAASAPRSRRNPARYNLARFYLARDMAAEAGAVATVALSDHKAGGDEVSGSVLKAVSHLLMHRPEAALKALANPKVGDQHDAPIWRAIAYSEQGKWDDARDGFKNVEGSMAALPIELQRLALTSAAHAAIEVHDFGGAAKLMDEIATIGVPPEMGPSISVLTGRLDQGLGRNEEALAAYHAAASSQDRSAAAEGQLREIELRMSSGDLSHVDAIRALETLTTVWRGDNTEIEGLKILAHLYTEEARYRDAFHVMRTAMMSHPNSDLTRKIQDEAAATFDSLFLDGKGDSMPPIEALGLFYDYRELTPIGRRGDEMIRKLADRLVSVDLLDQAAELLQHQVDHRLQGAARAQVATRLAVIYLMNRKADRALKTLQSTRSAELSNELRDQRLLLEARALSEIGRHTLALEVIADLKGRQAIRLRSDILWQARRWREAAEQLELLYGDRWKQFTPLTEAERKDILRAAIGYALGDEPMGLQSFREKYAPKMADGADRRAFDVVTAPIGTSGAEFREVARKVASLDTLDAFLNDMRKRYPSASALSPGALPPEAKAEKPQAAAPATVPAAKPAKAAVNAPTPNPASLLLPAKLPEGKPLKPDPAPTGTVSRPYYIDGRGF